MKALTPSVVEALLDDVVEVQALIPAGSTATSTVTDPAGTVTHPDVTLANDVASLEVTVSAAGRWVVSIVVPGTGSVPFIVDVSAVTPQSGLPTRAQVKAYLSSNGETSQDDDVIDEALAAELVNQRKVCEVPAVYGADLAEALKRRVARNLAARAVPIASISTFEGGVSSARVTRYDAEIDRFEGPYRRIEVG